MECIHAFLRVLVVLIATVPVVGPLVRPMVVLLPALGYTSAKKHALRYRDAGCVKSHIHCAPALTQEFPVPGWFPDHVCGPLTICICYICPLKRVKSSCVFRRLWQEGGE
jgi:hypothetical protein